MNLKNKQELAHLLFDKGETQKEIAGKVGVTAATVNHWVDKLSWKEQRTAMNLTRPQLINRLLLALNEVIEKLLKEGNPENIGKITDQLSKITSSIEKLDKKTNIVDVIDIFSAFEKWMQQRMSDDQEITPELLKTINSYHDKYVNVLISTQQIGK